MEKFVHDRLHDVGATGCDVFLRGTRRDLVDKAMAGACSLFRRNDDPAARLSDTKRAWAFEFLKLWFKYPMVSARNNVITTELRAMRAAGPSKAFNMVLNLSRSPPHPVLPHFAQGFMEILKDCGLGVLSTPGEDTDTVIRFLLLYLYGGV